MPTMAGRTHADPRVLEARRALLEGVGAEVSASFPGITRLGGQVVAALYLADTPQSMDALCAELGVSKSNVFVNLRALDAAGIVERQRSAGARHDVYALRGKYPDVVIGAYLARVRVVIDHKKALTRRALALLGDAKGDKADALRRKVTSLGRKYERFGEVFDAVMPVVGASLDLEAVLDRIPPGVVKTLAAIARATLGGGPGKVRRR